MEDGATYLGERVPDVAVEEAHNVLVGDVVRRAWLAVPEPRRVVYSNDEPF